MYLTCFRGPLQSAACTSPVLLFYLQIAYKYDITHHHSSEFFQELIIDALLHKNTRTSYTRLTFIIIEYHVGASFDRTCTHVGTNWKKKVNVLLKYIGWETYKIPKEAHLTAWSRSVSSNTTQGLFPPNSNDTTFKLDSAAAFKILRPVRVLPVKVTFSISGCWLIACPTV